MSLSDNIILKQTSFRCLSNKKILLPRFVQEAMETFSEKYWQIGSFALLCEDLEFYKKHHWKQVFQLMIEIATQTIVVTNDKVLKYKNFGIQINLLKDVQNIKFAQLKQLHLSTQFIIFNLDGNNIVNIQAISYLDCQNLQVLDIGFNHGSQTPCLERYSGSSQCSYTQTQIRLPLFVFFVGRNLTQIIILSGLPYNMRINNLVQDKIQAKLSKLMADLQKFQVSHQNKEQFKNQSLKCCKKDSQIQNWIQFILIFEQIKANQEKVNIF